MADCTAVADGQPAAVLWLHGLGDSGRGWSFLQEKLAPHFEYVKWEMPDAPVKRIEHFGGHEMPAWFGVPPRHGELSESSPEDVEGMSQTVAAVHAMIDKLEHENGIPPDRVVLGGFSQGAVISVLAGLSYPKRLAGIVGFSGWAARRDAYPEHIAEAQKGPPNTPVLLVHGSSDAKVPFSLAKSSRDFLASHGIEAQWVEYPMGHSVAPTQIGLLQRFLEKVLPEREAALGGASGAVGEGKRGEL